MTTATLSDISTRLHQARLAGKPIPQFGKTLSLTESEAYDVQDGGIRFREEMGEKAVGLKMGLTSEAKRKQMDIHSPLYGVLTDKMTLADQGTFSLQGSIHPKIEPEIAFVFRDKLEGKVTRDEVLNACEGVCAALEILDSRYDQFKYFSFEEVICDNSSSSHFALGPLIKEVQSIPVEALSMTMRVNGEVATEGSSAAISGDPVVSVLQLCELLARRGQSIQPGSIVLTGAATLAVPLEPHTEVTLEVEGLPGVSLKVTP